MRDELLVAVEDGDVEVGVRVSEVRLGLQQGLNFVLRRALVQQAWKRSSLSKSFMRGQNRAWEFSAAYL